MISLFRRNPAQEAAELAYRRVVEHSRQAAFFTYCGVPDTLDGRFELICLHAFLYLHRLKQERPQAAAIGQYFVDAMFADMDRSLREIGTGDLSVGRQVNRMAQAFYGRVNAYERGLDEGASMLRAALARNLFGTVTDSGSLLDTMATYVLRAIAELDGRRADGLLAGRISFAPAPASEPADVSPPARGTGALQ